MDDKYTQGFKGELPGYEGEVILENGEILEIEEIVKILNGQHWVMKNMLSKKFVEEEVNDYSQREGRHCRHGISLNRRCDSCIDKKESSPKLFGQGLPGLPGLVRHEMTVWDLYASSAISNGHYSKSAAEIADEMMKLREERKK